MHPRLKLLNRMLSSIEKHRQSEPLINSFKTQTIEPEIHQPQFNLTSSYSPLIGAKSIDYEPVVPVRVYNDLPSMPYIVLNEI